MQQYLDSIKLSIETNNYFGAIALALTLPDICASIEAQNNKTNQHKYCRWFDKYLLNKYTIFSTDGNIVVFSAKECYATRCSFLHQGTHITEHQDIISEEKNAVKSVNFMNDTIFKGYIRLGDEITLDVKIFCQNMIIAVEQWILENRDNDFISKKISFLPLVYTDTEKLPFVTVPNFE
ncbi:hypothetical protein B9T36_11015 [Acinetobacter sp. ANC 4204]|uniref:hypothetical protein n=1 Tax=Acinetobacter sp. ANC 4204 TaxID=1977884 RepID=UPI000A350467|nr:hypothetical protein [Acinetobacter sp. ANC 4204]OTG58860.1 hypothetical protein B9T36_11015 [Acinetobacter sp. ANC 4204]